MTVWTGLNGSALGHGSSFLEHGNKVNIFSSRTTATIQSYDELPLIQLPSPLNYSSWCIGGSTSRQYLLPE